MSKKLNYSACVSEWEGEPAICQCCKMSMRGLLLLKLTFWLENNMSHSVWQNKSQKEGLPKLSSILDFQSQFSIYKINFGSIKINFGSITINFVTTKIILHYKYGISRILSLKWYDQFYYWNILFSSKHGPYFCWLLFNTAWGKKYLSGSNFLAKINILLTMLNCDPQVRSY